MKRMIAITIKPGRDHGRVAADRAGERLAHHPATGGDEHQEERAEQLREQPAPLLRRVLEVLDRLVETQELVGQRRVSGVHEGVVCHGDIQARIGTACIIHPG